MSTNQTKKSESSSQENSVKENQIIDVWKENLEEEMKNVCALVEQGYNVIAMDTEFPGIIYAISNQQMAHVNSWYEVLQKNVNELNLIQVGITLSNKEGVKPQPVNTWQFNLEFSLSKNKYSGDSINILKEAGIDFDQLEVSFFESRAKYFLLFLRVN
jgi:CCR4-NOT transcription complex subunit 7/8